MPIDGLTLGFAARELHALLAGGRIDRVAQPDRDQLLLTVRAGGENRRLLIAAGPGSARLNLTRGDYKNPPEAPMFCMLLRKHLTGGRVAGVTQLGGDRLVLIDLRTSGELGEPREEQLVFEAMGKHTNLSLVFEGRVVDAIRHVTDGMSRVRRLLPGEPFVMPPAQDRLSPDEADAERLHGRLSALNGRLDKALAETVCGLSALSAREIALRLTGGEEPLLKDLDLPLFCEKLADFIKRLPDMAAPVLLRDGTGAPADVFPFPYLSFPMERQERFPSLSEALDALHFERDRRGRLRQDASSLRKLLRGASERCGKKLALQEEEIASAAKMDEYRAAGEALIAFGNQVPRGAREALLPDFRGGGELKVSLDPALGPSANAQRYFKKYRKAAVARRVAAEQKENTLRELSVVEEALFALDLAESAEDIGELREALRQAGLLRRDAPAKGRKREKESEALSFLTSDGFRVLVGKNSLQNERLLKLAGGEDLWFHSKDVPGSHVILRAEGREPGDAAILEAAKLAAYHSGTRGAEVTVDCTMRKFVKKTAGAPAGHVTYTRQRALLVSADEAFVRGLRRG